ncbi:hypothetical protein BLNAU_16932 [Blattamonas nauphoetae]|uniref:Uncharacterized protein n=1 Tax=Blattamonas nauphoetae TaxID=2049346 RepID=A0ABQ9XBU5_9EUKA|nr:hypothetical protein BLNAU_16932 [Blattamonas nauphoetae]
MAVPPASSEPWMNLVIQAASFSSISLCKDVSRMALSPLHCCCLVGCLAVRSNTKKGASGSTMKLFLFYYSILFIPMMMALSARILRSDKV